MSDRDNSAGESWNLTFVLATKKSPQTLRYKLFAKAAYITTESRKPILNLALAMQQRAWMQGLWDAAKTFDLPATFTPVYSP